jgi:1-acyl-sn-glycerol-3-phosphate acyltransferase
MKESTIRIRRIVAWAYGLYAWTTFILVVLLCGGMVVLLQSPSMGRHIARCATRLLFRIAGMPVSAVNIESLPSCPHILISNHTSFLDGIVLTALLPPHPGYSFVVRQEFSSQSLLWPLLRGLGAILLRRADRPHRTSNKDMLSNALRAGKSLIIFPEGGFSPEPGLRPFHSGAFVVSATENVPIVLCGLRGARAALRPGSWLPRRISIELEIGPVLTPSGSDPETISRLSADARREILLLCGEPDLNKG